MFVNLKRSGKSSQVNDFIWNLIGAGLVATQSAILLIVISRYYGQYASGMISIAYAFAVLAFTIARYGIRNYQVTDQNNEYSFAEYLLGRVFSVVITIMLLIVYLGIQFFLGVYSLEKTVLISEVVLLRMINAIEDVFLGRYQQIGRFVIGAKIMALREGFLLILLLFLMLLKINLGIVFGVGVIFSAFCDTVLIYIYRKDLLVFDEIQCRRDFDRIWKMLKENLPLCIGTGFAIYVSNIPKYATDWYLDEYSQAIVAYLILPVFTIALFSQFIYTPFVKQLGDTYLNGDYKSFGSKIKYQILLTSGLAVVVCAFCLLIGLPILSVLYNLDLTVYRMEFAVLLLGGTFYAVEYYLAIPVTILHKQKQLGAGYALAIIIAFVFQKRIVLNYGIMGVSVLYCVVNLVVLLFFLGIIAFEIKTQKDI